MLTYQPLTRLSHMISPVAREAGKCSLAVAQMDQDALPLATRMET